MKRYYRLQLRITEGDRLKVRTDARAGGLSVADHLRRVLGLTERERRTYTCAMCSNTYLKGWTDKEAYEEHKENFPGTENAPRDTVCDPCYRRLMGLAPREAVS